MSSSSSLRLRRARVAFRVVVGVGTLVAAGFTTLNAKQPPTPLAATHRAPPAPAPSAVHRDAPVPKPRATSEELPATDGTPEVMVFSPKGGDLDAPRPVTVMLHGMCDVPKYECPWFAPAVTEGSWLVCPRGGVRCAGGGYTWDESTMQVVESAVQRVALEHPDAVDLGAGRTLIGFSMGGIAGMDLAHRAAGRYPRVILIAAKIFPQASLLRQQGVERLVLAAGDNDMTRWHMFEQARRTDRRGLPTRFISFGKVGHRFPANLTEYMRDALDWVSAPVS